MANELVKSPTQHPAEVLDISPEALEVSNCYLQCQDLVKTADELNIPVELVQQILGRREVKAYIDSVFFNYGFNNKFKIRRAIDAIISKKFEELEEAGIGSSKDITEILALSHKMTIDQLNIELQIEKLRAANGPKSQVNVQINEAGGSNYGSLIERLMKAGV